MAKVISTAVQTQADIENPWYTEIYHINLSGTVDDLFLTPAMPSGTTSDIAFSFGGQLYQSFAIQRSPVKSTADSEVDSVAVQFQNVDQVFGSLLLNNDIRGRPVTISGIFLASGTDAPISQSNDDLVPVFKGTIGSFTVDEDQVKMQLNFAINEVTVESPKRFYGPPLFDFIVPQFD